MCANHSANFLARHHCCAGMFQLACTNPKIFKISESYNEVSLHNLAEFYIILSQFVMLHQFFGVKHVWSQTGTNCNLL